MQFMADLPACLEDIEAFKKAMEYFGLTDPDNTYVLHNASAKECNSTISAIRQAFLMQEGGFMRQ